MFWYIKKTISIIGTGSADTLCLNSEFSFLLKTECKLLAGGRHVQVVKDREAYYRKLMTHPNLCRLLPQYDSMLKDVNEIFTACELKPISNPKKKDKALLLRVLGILGGGNSRKSPQNGKEDKDNTPQSGL